MNDRRRTRRLAVLALTTLVVAPVTVGCVEGYTGTELRSSATPGTARPAEVRAASPVVLGLGADVLGALAATEAGNVGVSPSTLALQLSMVAAGAGTSSASALDALLGGEGLTSSTGGRITLHGAVALPADRSGTERSPQRTGSVAVGTAVALWIQRGPAVTEAFLEELALAHDRGVRQLDFRSDPEGARAAVNLWTSGATGGRVTEAAPGGSVTSATRLLSTGAQSVTAPWLVPFNAAATVPEPFTTASGEVVEVPMMTVEAPTGLQWARGGDWQAVALPYLGRELMVVVALPDPGTPALTERLDAALLTTILERLRPRALSVRLPRLTLSLDVSLSETLSGLGAGVVFDTDLADFTPAAPTERLALTDVLQAVRFTVDEEGSEGRAATVTSPGERPVPTTPQVVVDRPFLLMVVDVPTRIPLLLAEVVDPS